MNIQQLAEIAKEKFPVQIEAEQFFEHDQIVLRAKVNNDYLAIVNTSTKGLIEMNFFKSDYKVDKIWDDYLTFGISFYPKDLEHAKNLIEAVH